MDAIAEKALDKSIEKWEKIVDGKGFDYGARDCALCEEYYYNDEFCVRCPIYLKTGAKYCNKTPYRKWNIHHHNSHFIVSFGRCIKCDECKKLAQEELDFLRSLKPKKKEEN